MSTEQERLLSQYTAFQLWRMGSEKRYEEMTRRLGAKSNVIRFPIERRIWNGER